MNPHNILAGALFAAAVSLNGAAFAGADDYAFEPVKAEVKKGDHVTLTVRLVHKPTGKPVSDAVIVSPRIDMSPEGMETMTAPITPAKGAQPGTYSFTTDLAMAGRWLLTVSAKVQGEQETVTGKVTFKATD
jgi:YtkA-like protein